MLKGSLAGLHRDYDEYIDTSTEYQQGLEREVRTKRELAGPRRASGVSDSAPMSSCTLEALRACIVCTRILILESTCL